MNSDGSVIQEDFSVSVTRKSQQATEGKTEKMRAGVDGGKLRFQYPVNMGWETWHFWRL